MAEPLKYIYSYELFEKFINVFAEVMPSVDQEKFLNDVFDPNWDSMELKERMHHVTNCLDNNLSESYEENISCFLSFITIWQKRNIQIGRYDSLAFMFLPDYIEQYGLSQFDIALKAMEQITEFTSCEFAIRPFIIKYPDQCISKLIEWSSHPNLHVRRLASEGCRPRLPWAIALPDFKKDPTPILPILENLKSDSSDYVRRSVANNLNDIAKDNPQLVIETSKRWIGSSKVTDWIVKHACRTLLKQGNQELMRLFGYAHIDNLKISDFKLITPKVKIGGHLEFSCKISNLSKSKSKIRLEYGIYYLRANGSHSKKVFKISETVYAESSESLLIRKQSFKPITTRKFYPGEHYISVIVNGVEMEKMKFEILD